MMVVVVGHVMSCHVMSSRRRRFATVGCMDESVTSNTFCLSQCVAGYHPIDQSTGRMLSNQHIHCLPRFLTPSTRPTTTLPSTLSCGCLIT